MCHRTFFIRKVGKRTSHRLYHFILAKLLRFQRTFHEKSFVSGFGADSPNWKIHKKTRHCRVFLISRKKLELRSSPPSLTFLIRKVSKRISRRTHHFTLAKAFEVYCVGVPRQTPQHSTREETARQCRAVSLYK